MSETNASDLHCTCRRIPWPYPSDLDGPYQLRIDPECKLHGERAGHRPEYDPTPYCTGCGAMRKADCHCGPIAENE